MDFNQLLDSLTAHLALYHSSIPRSSPSPPSNPRQSILRWFSSLTPPQRQAALTTVDQNWTSLLLQMQTRLSKSGHGFFMLLPDFPSQIPPFLPSLCFRKSSGLLARVSASNNAERSIFNSVRIFASQEGERIGDCSCSLDSITVSEDFVRDLDRFVAAMDGLSNGSFLSGESPAFGSWEELPWLKSKGYYSIESFVANKLELALRLSWIHCHGKKRGAKSKGLSNVAGVASNLFWRKKGCLDWWAGLEPGLRKKIFRLVTAKAAKCLANEIVKGSNDVLKDDMWFFSRGLEHAPWYGSTAACGIIHAVSGIDAEFHLGMMPAPSSGKPSSLATISNCLLVLQEMSALILAFQYCEFETEELFFSPLGSVNTVSDRILRSVRGFLMHASSDCIKLELLGDENSKVTPNKSKEKFAASSQKGKSKGQRAKKLNSRAKSRQAGLSPEIPSKDGSGNLQKVPSVEANRKTPAVNAGNPVKDLCKESELSGMVMEPAKGSVDCEAQITCKKRGKANSKGKRENPSLQGPVTSMDTQTLIMDWCVTSEGSASPSTSNMDLEHQNHGDLTDSALAMVVSSSPNLSGPLVSVDKTPPLQNEEDNVRGNACSTGSTSYEWPSLGHVHLTSHNSQHLPAATDRLHLDVGRNWRNHFQHSFISTTSLDWPPAVRSVSRLSSSLAYNFDSGFIPRVPTSFRSGEAVVDSCGSKNAQDLSDDCESHWIYEEESEVLALSGRDYNQFFGGGVMYWNTSDHVGTGFSRPPSLSSEDSSWAWHEADLNRAIDDMVGLPGLPPSYCATVPDAAAEEKVSGLLTNSSVGVVEGMAGDSLSYPILRPIVIPSISRKGTRSEFMVSHGIKSPCVPCTRREPPRIKRPQSPVVLCVPQARRPPPPSPVCESKKQRGFPTVRSGSSSPRHWGMRNWSHDETNGEEPRLCVDGAEVVWPSWRNKGLTTTPMMQPLPGSLLHDRLIAISQLGLDQEHPDVAFPLQSPDLLNCPARKMSLSTMHSILHEEIDSFCKQVASQNQTRKPYINWAVKRVARLLQVLWPRSRTNIFGSNATGLALPSSDVDLVVCLPPVRNLEPIKEAGILEGRNGIKETCLQHAARYLANQEWVKNDSLKTIENTTIPVIMLVAEVPHDLIASNGTTSMLHMSKDVSAQMVGGERTSSVCETSFSESSSESMCSQRTGGGMDMRSVRLDISFESPSHTGLQTTELVRWFTEQFPPAIPLALVLKQFLADRSLDHSYSGGLSSYCLVLLITRFLQHEHHIGRLVNQNLGSLLMDFLYFFGNVFDPRQMRISVQGSGVYINRERGHSIDPIHIDDPLYPANNVGRNCFRIHQCIKYMAQAFADAYSILENELTSIPVSGDPSKRTTFSLLSKIILSINPG